MRIHFNKQSYINLIVISSTNNEQHPSINRPEPS